MWWGCQIGQKFTGLIRPYVNWLRDLGGLDHPFPSVAGLPDCHQSGRKDLKSWKNTDRFERRTKVHRIFTDYT